MRITVWNYVTLDGVMQGPASAEEDTRDGFTQGQTDQFIYKFRKPK